MCFRESVFVCSKILCVILAKSSEWSPRLLFTHAEGENADGVVGLSVIGSNVYVVRSWTSKVEVCDASTFAVKRAIHVPDLDLPYDMTGCNQQKCLYLTDYGTDVHRIDVGAGGTVNKWRVGEGQNLTVSVCCSTTNVLVTIGAGQKVIFCHYIHLTLWAEYVGTNACCGVFFRNWPLNSYSFHQCH